MNDSTDMPDLSRFDAVEVMPVYEDPDEGFCEPVPDAPHTATFWTVYGNLKESGVEALIDCADERSAEIAAFIFERALYGQTVTDLAAKGGAP